MPKNVIDSDQKYPIVAPSPDGGLVPINDIRLPQNAIMYTNKDIQAKNYGEYPPIDPAVTEIKNNEVSTVTKVVFNISGGENMLIDFANSEIRFKLNLYNAATGVELTAADIAAMSQIHLQNAGAVTLNDYCRFVYMRSVYNLFNKIEISDFETHAVLEVIDHLDLLKALELTNSSSDFWDVSGEFDKAYSSGAMVHKFMPDACLVPAGGTHPTVSHIIPHVASLPSALGATIAGDYVFDDVRKTLNNMAEGFEFAIPIPSDLLNRTQCMSAHFNKLRMELTLNTYKDAFTDVNCVATGAGVWGAPTSNCNGYIIRDMKLCLTEYTLNAEAANRLKDQFMGAGWSRPYTGILWQHARLEQDSTRLTIPIDQGKIHSLDSVAIVIRKASDIVGTAQTSKFEFTTGAAEGQTYQTYGGVKSLEFEYLQTHMPKRPLEMKPGQFRFIHRLSSDIFVEGDWLQKYQYEGIDPVSCKWVNGAQTGFYLGYDFSTLSAAMNSGLDLSQGSLQARLDFGATHPALEFDIFIFYDMKLETNAKGIIPKK